MFLLMSRLMSIVRFPPTPPTLSAAGGNGEFKIPKVPKKSPQKLLLHGQSDAAKQQRNAVAAEILPILWPTNKTFCEYLDSTGCNGSKRSELSVLDKYGRLAPIWSDFQKHKDARKLQLAAIAATVNGKRSAEKGPRSSPKTPSSLGNSHSNTIPNQSTVRQSELSNVQSSTTTSGSSSYASRARKALPQVGDPNFNPHFLRIYLHDGSKPHQYRALEESVWNKLMAQIMTKMFTKGKSTYPQAPVGWAKQSVKLPSHGWIKPSSEEDRKLFQELISSLVVDGLSFKAWTAEELAPQFARIQISSNGKADMYAGVEIDVLLDALLSVNFSQFTDDDIKYISNEQPVVNNSKNFAINLDVRKPVWDFIIERGGVARVFMEEWRVFYYYTHLNKKLEFPTVRNNDPTPKTGVFAKYDS